jgi:hypothetical protein
MSLVEKASIWAAAAEQARLAGNAQASIELAIVAAQLLQLHRFLYGGEK